MVVDKWRPHEVCSILNAQYFSNTSASPTHSIDHITPDGQDLNSGTNGIRAAAIFAEEMKCLRNDRAPFTER